jgi:hypothetical protein
VAKKKALEAVGDHGSVANQAAPVGEETAGIADDDRRNPHLGDEIGGEEACERHGIDLVGLDASGGDELDGARVGDDDLGHERRDLVVEIPGVGGGLNDEDVGGLEMNCSPCGPSGKLDPARGEDGFELGTDATNDGVILVEIDSEETGSGWRENGI